MPGPFDELLGLRAPARPQLRIRPDRVFVAPEPVFIEPRDLGHVGIDDEEYDDYMEDEPYMEKTMKTVHEKFPEKEVSNDSYLRFEDRYGGPSLIVNNDQGSIRSNYILTLLKPDDLKCCIVLHDGVNSEWIKRNEKSTIKVNKETLNQDDF